jgi:hypothetical protein
MVHAAASSASGCCLCLQGAPLQPGAGRASLRGPAEREGAQGHPQRRQARRYAQ